MPQKSLLTPHLFFANIKLYIMRSSQKSNGDKVRRRQNESQNFYFLSAGYGIISVSALS
jgi:hypothetical protein